MSCKYRLALNKALGRIARKYSRYPDTPGKITLSKSPDGSLVIAATPTRPEAQTLVVALGKQTPQATRFHNALEGDDHGGVAQTAFVLVRHLIDFFRGLVIEIGKLFVHLCFSRPE